MNASDCRALACEPDEDEAPNREERAIFAAELAASAMETKQGEGKPHHPTPLRGTTTTPSTPHSKKTTTLHHEQSLPPSSSPPLAFPRLPRLASPHLPWPPRIASPPLPLPSPPSHPITSSLIPTPALQASRPSIKKFSTWNRWKPSIESCGSVGRGRGECISSWPKRTSTRRMRTGRNSSTIRCPLLVTTVEWSMEQPRHSGTNGTSPHRRIAVVGL